MNLNIVNRFITRLGLHEFAKPTINIKEVITNSNQIMLNSWTNMAMDKPILQLYHATRCITTNKSIMENGFIIGSACNKGRGVYLANHSRYSAFWAGCNNGVLVCDVIYDYDHVKRYKSEIKSPIFNSEYVVTNPRLIYPRYLINYDLHITWPNTQEQFPAGWVDHGKFGCPRCDSNDNFYHMPCRCDCPHDSYDSNDLQLD